MKISFILQDNSERTVDFIEGETILQIAEKNGIHIKHNCEGFGVCGQCHVLIEDGAENLSEISDLEMTTLDKANNVTINSRLACRIILNKNNDGLKVRIP